MRDKTFCYTKKVIKALILSGAALLFIFLVAKAQAATMTVIEAENMTVTGATNKAVTNGWALMGEAKFTSDIEFYGGMIDLEIIAKGDYAGGAWPIMEVKIDDTVIGTVDVDSATWESFFIKQETASAGIHKLSVAFINDFYEKPADRNFYMDKVTITETMATASVTVAWDCNEEPDLEGYRIYTGLKSRFDKTDAIDEWCLEHEPTNEKCKEEWEAICKEDPGCSPMLFDYDDVLDVRTDTAGWASGCTAPYDPFKAECCEYTIKGLVPGTTYYLAGIAYDVDGNISSFSEELIHKVSFEDPAAPEVLIFKMPAEE